MAECARSSHRRDPWQAFRGPRATAVENVTFRAPSPGLAVAQRRLTVENGPKLVMVMSLKQKADFLLRGVVLQNRIVPVSRPMFHVKHFCVKAALAAAPSPRSRRASPRDVSRETFLRKAARPIFVVRSASAGRSSPRGSARAPQ